MMRSASRQIGKNKMKEFDKLVRIMKKLRHPERGCPWDNKQTAESLRDYILEESHELIEAIDGKDPDKIREELGDLLLQIVFLARLQEEKGHFTIREVLETIIGKLVHRHPHIFGETKVADAEEVRINWERIKMAEKNKESILSDYPERMPALLTAHRIASQASGVGFDWNNALQALEKVEEEAGELKKEILEHRSTEAEQEIGDLLFAVANVARLLRINPEFALAGTNRKFSKRFRFIEKEMKKAGKDIRHSTLEEMESLWQQSKKE
jgi:MazG family protein